MAADDVEFVCEMRLTEGDPFWNRNRNAHQVMLEGVVVKQEQEDTSDENKYHVADEIAGYLRRSDASQLKMSEESKESARSKVIHHRRCARISKLNTVAIRRYLVLRKTTQGDVIQPTMSSGNSERQMPFKPSNEEMGLIPTAPKETMFCQQDVNSIHGRIEDNGFSQIQNSAHSRASHGMPCATAVQKKYENVDETQTPVLTFESVHMNIDVAQYLEIEMDGAAAKAIENIILNRCEACVQTFKTPKNLEKHLKSKKHEKQTIRLNKRKHV